MRGGAEEKENKTQVCSAATLHMLSRSSDDNNRLQVEKFLMCQESKGNICGTHGNKIYDSSALKRATSLPLIADMLLEGKLTKANIGNSPRPGNELHEKIEFIRSIKKGVDGEENKE